MSALHGTGCICGDCSHIEVLLNFGRWDFAIHEAYSHGLLSDAELELAWRTGTDPLALVGFTNTAVTVS